MKLNYVYVKANILIKNVILIKFFIDETKLHLDCIFFKMKLNYSIYNSDDHYN